MKVQGWIVLCLFQEVLILSSGQDPQFFPQVAMNWIQTHNHRDEDLSIKPQT